jgi:hypothetical protein
VVEELLLGVVVPLPEVLAEEELLLGVLEALGALKEGVLEASLEALVEAEEACLP